MRSSEASDGVAEFVTMFGKIGTANIGELDVFEMFPHPFIGVEIGGVAGQSLQPESAVGLRQQFLDGTAAVDR